MDFPDAHSWVLAKLLCDAVGMPATGANQKTVQLAIESEAAFSNLSLAQAAALIASAAFEVSVVRDGPSEFTWPLSFQAKALLRKSNHVNRFWFEDALWRVKEVYFTMLTRLGVSDDRLDAIEMRRSA